MVSEHLLELEVAWQQHVGSDMQLFERLMGRHREKHRKYHTAQHVSWVVRHVDELAADESPDDLGAIVAAALYHDAIYEPASPANERASARLARRDLAGLGWDDERVSAVSDMIEGTKHHLDPADTDTAILFDADLAVLAADPASYGDYTRGVRAEYRHVDDDDWVTGRIAVLDGFLDRPSIYATASGRERWEDRARANLAAELATLR
jgi:predicted metal-dependent HD superfamily phosphohydrolase